MSNRLSREASPYLQQHADNPVDWYPWGAEAFERARQGNLPIHLSVGYAACHWCHVMAHESFEDPRTAGLLNERFVNIKVDRQERPDVDDVYQKVVQMMGESGGWPLTVFLTPQREPFFGGTYFPPQDRYGRPGFPSLIVALSDAWKRQDQDLLSNVEAFKYGFGELDRQAFQGEAVQSEDLPLVAARALAEHTDPVYGGLKGAPKFPNPSSVDLMLRAHARTREAALLTAVQTTLDRMGAGGIYDHLGGGFSRYSVDERWAVPHFEKMLYDNGQLVRLYADAYRLTGKPSWRRIFEGTIEYVLRDLSHPEGGFFASEDADSEGEEGRFYVWTPAQVNQALGPRDGAFACRALGITEHGNFEGGRSVPHRAIELDAADEARLDALRARLYESCFDARYLAGAGELADRILEKFWDDGLYFTAADAEALVHRPRSPFDHAWPSGTSSTAFGLFRLYELTGKLTYRERAERVARDLQAAAARNAFGFSHLLAAMDFAQQGPMTIVFAGESPDVQPLVQAIHRAYVPARALALAQHVPAGLGRTPVNGQPAAYVCRNQTCQAPVTTAEALREIVTTAAPAAQRSG
ncbi:MAG: thioredoxin domain-containing protein [Betaproteobacteria bacterium]|nr:MAG: thioredoxin domain-containing protein [Betaproteobacteria bacterium]